MGRSGGRKSSLTTLVTRSASPVTWDRQEAEPLARKVFETEFLKVEVRAVTASKGKGKLDIATLPDRESRDKLLSELKEIEDRGPVVSDEDRDKAGVEEVALKDIIPFLEFDRELFLGPWQRDSAMIDSVRRNGILNPIRIIFNPDINKAYVIEGNHRVGYARLAGLKTVPAQVLVSSTDYRPNGSDAALPELFNKAEEGSLVPPSAIGIGDADKQTVLLQKERSRQEKERQIDQDPTAPSYAERVAELVGNDRSDQAKQERKVLRQAEDDGHSNPYRVIADFTRSIPFKQGGRVVSPSCGNRRGCRPVVKILSDGSAHVIEGHEPQKGCPLF